MLDRFPKISIVTPSFNQVEYLEQTIKSVLSQKYPNLEYIIVDGGSTDGSVEIIKKYEDRLSYWVSEPDKGHAHALNKGFAKATGDIMAWLNSDDIYFSWTLITVAEVFSQHPDIEWITGRYSFIDRKGRLKGLHPYIRTKFDYITDYNGHMQQESVFWKRSLWQRTGGYIDESYELLIDKELWCRFFRYSNCWHIDRVLAAFRGTDTNRSKLDPGKTLRESKKASMGLKAYMLKKDGERLRDLINLYHLSNLRKRAKSYFYQKLYSNRLLAILPYFIYNKVRQRIIESKLPKLPCKLDTLLEDVLFTEHLLVTDTEGTFSKITKKRKLA